VWRTTLGWSDAVSINQFVDIIENIAGIKLQRNFDLSPPNGVNAATATTL
jgi:hypothetical protein